MTRTEPYLIRLAEHLAQLPPAERKPFVTRQRERWEGLYLQFQLLVGCDDQPSDTLAAPERSEGGTAWDYAETIGALEKLEATL